MKAIPLLQVFYYVATGLLSLLSRRGFERLTGPKTDFWLVRAVGFLVTIIGFVIGSAVMNRRVSPEIKLLAMGSAASLGSIGAWYALKGRISKIYLIDAIVEIIIVLGWLRLGKRR